MAVKTISYFRQVYDKKQIVLHHTGGGHNPDYVIDGWNKNFKAKIGTAYVIGGIGNELTRVDRSMDGIVREHFDPKYWAYHLGIKEKKHIITENSIGIELCNFGQLNKANGKYITYVNTRIPDDQVTKLKFRDFDYYESYTNNQIYSLEQLLIHLGNTFNIDIRCGLQELINSKGKKAFDYNESAIAGDTGVWTHTNFRLDKFDCSPQQNLIDMILSL